MTAGGRPVSTPAEPSWPHCAALTPTRSRTTWVVRHRPRRPSTPSPGWPSSTTDRQRRTAALPGRGAADGRRSGRPGPAPLGYGERPARTADRARAAPTHQYGQVWVHQLSLMTQQQQAAQAEPADRDPRQAAVRLRPRAARPAGSDADLAVYRKLSTRTGRPARPRAANGRPRAAAASRTSSATSRAWPRRSSAGAAREPGRAPGRNDSTYSPAAAATAWPPSAPSAAATPSRTPRAIFASRSSSRSRRSKPPSRTSRARPRTRRPAPSAPPTRRPVKEDQAAAEDTAAGPSARPSGPAGCGWRRLPPSTKRGATPRWRDAYQQAATDAGQALAGYQTLLSRARRPEPRSRPDRRAGPGGGREESTPTRRASRQAIPVNHLWRPVCRPDERLAVPVDEINQMLAKNGSSQRIADRRPDPGAGRRVPPAAVPRRHGLHRRRRLRTTTSPRSPRSALRMKARDLTEVIESRLRPGRADVRHPRRRRPEHRHHQHPLVERHRRRQRAAVPGAGRAGGRLCTRCPRCSHRAVEVVHGPHAGRDRGRDARTPSLGWVDDNRGESLLYEWPGEWEIEVRELPHRAVVAGRDRRRRSSS